MSLLGNNLSQASEPGDQPGSDQLPGSAAESLVTPQQEAPKEATPPALTEADVRRIAAEVARPIAQRQTGKAEGRIQTEINRRFQDLEKVKGSLKLSDDQVSAAQDKIIRDVLTEDEQPGAGQQQQQPQAGQQQAQQQEPQSDFDRLPVPVQQALWIMEYGKMRVEEGDAEFTKYLKPILDSGNFEALPEATTIAMGEKRARLLKNKQSAALRTGSAGSGGEASRTNLSPEDKISKGLDGEWTHVGPQKG